MKPNNTPLYVNKVITNQKPSNTSQRHQQTTIKHFIQRQHPPKCNITVTRRVDITINCNTD